MAKNYKTPGVYIEEISNLPSTVAQVETAIPSFVGYTATAIVNRIDYHNEKIYKPIKIKSLLEYELFFGGSPNPTSIEIEFNSDNSVKKVDVIGINLLYDSLRMFYANGGGDCYIVSVGKHRGKDDNVSKDDLKKGLDAIRKVDEPTLLVIPEVVCLNTSQAGELHVSMLSQCNELQDRFAILDIVDGAKEPTPTNDPVLAFRSNVGMNFLTYGASYYPWLITNLSFSLDYETLKSATYKKDGKPISDIDILLNNKIVYQDIANAINRNGIVLPPGSAIAGIYAKVDRERGVWKSPANVSLNAVKGPSINITNEDQDDLNIDAGTGISINAIRAFTGRGTMVWGARTLAGNDYEWRYIPIRRFFIMVKESIKKSVEKFVFEPNDANTWVKIKTMIENFLFLQWRAGALAGTKQEHAFFVSVGLGQTMTAHDIMEGRMNIEIGMAVIRPAEFKILRLSHNMQQP